MTDTVVSPVAESLPQLDEGSTGPEDCAHIVDQRDPANDITAAVIEGREVTALCGYKWIPYRAPEGRPVCEECVEAYGRMQR